MIAWQDLPLPISSGIAESESSTVNYVGSAREPDHWVSKMTYRARTTLRRLYKELLKSTQMNTRSFLQCNCQTPNVVLLSGTLLLKHPDLLLKCAVGFDPLLFRGVLHSLQF